MSKAERFLWVGTVTKIFLVVLAFLALSAGIYVLLVGTNFLPRATESGGKVELVTGSRTCTRDSDCILHSCYPPINCPKEGGAYYGKCVAGKCNYEVKK